MNSKIGRLGTGQNRIDSKIDRLMFFIVGGLVLKGGLDFYLLKEAQKVVEQKMYSIATEPRQEASYAAEESQEGLGQRGGFRRGGARADGELRWEEIDANRAGYRLPTTGPPPCSYFLLPMDEFYF